MILFSGVVGNQKLGVTLTWHGHVGEKEVIIEFTGDVPIRAGSVATA
jgi:hypothetical protein